MLFLYDSTSLFFTGKNLTYFIFTLITVNEILRVLSQSPKDQCKEGPVIFGDFLNSPAFTSLII